MKIFPSYLLDGCIPQFAFLGANKIRVKCTYFIAKMILICIFSSSKKRREIRKCIMSFNLFRMLKHFVLGYISRERIENW